MDYCLENDELLVRFHTDGAEMTRIYSKASDTDFLWNGDASYWKYHAPVLFPIVGKLIENQYRFDGKKYQMVQHGIARTSQFIVCAKEEDSMTFSLEDSEESLMIYPFRFVFQVEYKLVGKTIMITYQVKNKEDKTMYFSIGAHPAFCCPIFKDESIEDYYFEFESNETVSTKRLNQEGCLKREAEELLENEKVIQLNEGTFSNGALILESLSSKKVTLRSKNHNKAVVVDFAQFSTLGLWSKETGAPFVCIEPWIGHADYEDFSGGFAEKPGMIALGSKDEFACTFTIAIEE